MALPGSHHDDNTQETLPNEAPDRRQSKGSLVLQERQPFVHSADLPLVLSTTPTVQSLLTALRRRWRLALCLGLLCASAAAAGTWFSIPEKYTARTLVHIAANRPVVLGDTPENRTDFGSYQRTQIAWIKSRLVLNDALRDAKVAKLKVIQDEITPVVWLERQIQVDFAAAPEILRISMTGEYPDELVPIVNAVRESYFKEVRSREVGWRESRLKLLREIFTEAEKKLAEKRDTLKKLSQDLGSIKDEKAIERAQEIHGKTLDNIQNELLQTYGKLLRAKMEFEIQKAREGKTGDITLPPNLIEEHVQKDSQVKKYRGSIAKYDRDLEHMKNTFAEAEKEQPYKATLKLRETAEKELNALSQKLHKDVTKETIENIANGIQSSRFTYQEEIAILESQYKWLEEHFNQAFKTAKQLNKTKIDVEYLRGEIALEEDMAKRMASQSEHLQIEMKAPDRFTLLEDAFAAPDQDSRLKKTGLAGGGALAFILLAIAFLEFRSRRVSNIDEVVRGLKIRFVGSLPPLPSRARDYSAAKGANVRWKNQMNESIETTRTVLLHAAETDSLRVIVVTSAVGGEGKTLTCSHLAASLARAGRKTILIDADLRRPSLQRIFNLQTEPGFSELLRGDSDLAAVVQPGPVPGLAIIAAGSSDDRSIQALSQPILGELFKKFRKEYDFVIVDSAPILPVADSQVICQQADGVIFAVLRDVSRLAQVYSAHERLVALQIRIVGAVVNGTEGPIYGSSYPYGRGNSPEATA